MSLRLHQDFTLTETDFGAVLLHRRRGTYWQLNPSGALIVTSLLGGSDADGAVQRLVEQYDVDPGQARRDVDSLVADMRAAGALR
ncbi:lasso peptide biosynthesis PqqD family chaperone [Micromonospora tarensis]|uniref:Lasso peptide biosynthesis PqqD family chaperone n=1 Tax=Micromonospora tarensis TaxID=2806100 RepID=A0ABS1YAQ2_9ACTN|nr:lasso peptide biosynthesis PqqD family chaperone [Micromonospora tarensis]MBM0274450.1 lasso peptide biosynthesis PqqD family chaperone [Micromonospora tarensis]